LAGNQQKRLMWSLGGVALANILINSFLIQAFSYWGAAFTTCLTELSVAGIGWYLTRTYLNYTPRLLAFWKILGASIVMTLLLWILREQSLFLLLPLGIGVYIFFLWLFRAIEADEITSLLANRK
jgi:O-antigen/teichoic acid export membrane protein